MAPAPHLNLARGLGGSGSGETNSSQLLANLICRVIFGIIANLACIVPFRLLWKNGELPATIFVGTVMVLNLDCIVNALLWPNDDIDSWWPGYGFCDFHNYWYNAVVTLYASSNMAIMHNLSKQVGDLRASPLSRREKRNKLLVQCLIMFPLPILAIIWTYPIMSLRYGIGTLVGCSFYGDLSWPLLLFYHLPPPLLAMGSAYFAIVTWVRYRQVRKTTVAALSSSSMTNSPAAARSQRAQRKLYLMTLSILIPYLPMDLAFLGLALTNLFPLKPYNFNHIHHSNDPAPWDTIVYSPSSDIAFIYLNANYLPILTAIPIFWYFGKTKEGINMYRRALLMIGLGHIFPSLKEDYDPDRRRKKDGSSSDSRIWTTQIGSQGSQLNHEKGSMSTSTKILSTTSTVSTDYMKDPQPRIATSNLSARSNNSLDILPVQQPAMTATHQAVEQVKLPHRNPFLMRAHLDFSLPLQFPYLSKKSIRGSHTDGAQSVIYDGPATQPAGSKDDPVANTTFSRNRFRTKVWSENGAAQDDDARAAIGSSQAATRVVVYTQIASSTQTAKEESSSRKEKS